MEHFISNISSYGLPGIFMSFVMVNMGVPFPLPVLFGLLGTAVHAGKIIAAEAVVIVFSASLVGDLAAYGLFYTGGRPLLEYIFHRFRFKYETFERVENWYNRYGIYALLIVRWVNWGKTQLVWLCGLSRMPLGRFVLASVLAELPWSVAWSYLAVKMLGRTGGGVISWAAVVGVMAALQAALALGGLLFYKRYLTDNEKEKK